MEIKKYDRIFRIIKNVYVVPIVNSTVCSEDLYDYIDGLHGEFTPESSVLHLETKDAVEAETVLNRLGSEMDEAILDRTNMPTTVTITQYDLRAKFLDRPESKFTALDDRLTPIKFLNDINMEV